MEKAKNLTQKQRGYNSSPAQLANLKPFKKGQSGNPSGLPKGTPRISVALTKLLDTEPKKAYRPRTRAEQPAYTLFEKAMGENVMAVKEVIDRTEGKSAATVNVNTEPTPNVEAYRRAIMSRAQAIVDEYGITLEEALKGMAEARPEIKKYLN